MDEVGRGTSTNDGLSIAWGICEYLMGRIGARTLFATHFHELTALEYEKLVNLSLDVKDDGGEIVFLKKIRPGPASESYGLHVASLAGIPESVLRRAEEILGSLVPPGETVNSKAPVEETRIQAAVPGQLFDPGELVLGEIASLDVNGLTPLEALNRLDLWKKQLRDRS